MDKKVVWLLIILAVVVVFFSSLIIVMENLTNKPTGPSTARDARINRESSVSRSKQYDVFKPNKQIEKKPDILYTPNLEDKFTGKDSVLDI